MQPNLHVLPAPRTEIGEPSMRTLTARGCHAPVFTQTVGHVAHGA